MSDFLPAPLLLLLLLIANTATAQCSATSVERELASGRVYSDSNGNRNFDNGESGVAGVAVSNGCEVTWTDSDGRYEISIAATEFIFISQPSGYTVAVDENNIPQFFYRHYPDGTPTTIAGTSVEWLWPVARATGSLPPAIDFALSRRSDPSSSFTAHGFADPQARYELGEDMVREELVNTLIGNPYGAQFGLTVGDVLYDNLDLYDRHKQMMALMDIPQWYLPGNHDVNYESPNALFANETYKLHFGPTYYSFNIGDVHLVALNNVEYAGADKEIDGARYRGYISDRQLQWLALDLAGAPRDKLIVIASHIPLVVGATDASGVSVTAGPKTDNFGELLKILEPFPNIYGLAGHDNSNSWKVEINHTHGWAGQPWIAHTLAEVRGNGWTTGLQDSRAVRDAIMQDGNPNGYYLLKFNGIELIPEFIPFPFGPDASKRLRISLDLLPATSEGTGINRGAIEACTQVVVNLFNGGERDHIWMSLDGGARREMTHTVRTDPTVEMLYQQLQDTDAEIGRPTLSAHIWQLPLPDSLAEGIHRIEVNSEDEFGQTQQGAFSFEITTAR